MSHLYKNDQNFETYSDCKFIYINSQNSDNTDFGLIFYRGESINNFIYVLSL
jgi:hypothetical protein